MTFSRFLILLIALTIGAYLINMLLCQIEVLKPFWLFSFQTLIFFTLISLMIYSITWMFSVMGKNSLLTGWSMGVVFLKLIFCGTFLYLQIKNQKFNSNYFIILFFTNYFIYTIFELVYLSKFMAYQPSDK